MRLIVIACSLLVTPAAFAQSDGRSDGSSRVVDTMVACRTIVPDSERLACFDRAAGQVASARRSGELLVLDRSQVLERKRRVFGLANPLGDVFGGGDADRATQVTELITTIRAAAPASAYGNWQIELANGSLWQSIDTLMYAPKVGAPITLRRAPLGGYRASIGGARSFLVKRTR